MVVGEAPGAQEDREGLPFVGKAGELLTRMLQSISLDRRQDTFITNVCKCRPPQNRTPEFSEIQMCLPLLVKQVEIIAPKAILTLGKTAAQALLDRSDTIGKLRTKSHRFRSIPLVVTYHPAALLRNPSLKHDAYHDLCSCKTILDTATTS
jgi:DNA polymerase